MKFKFLIFYFVFLAPVFVLSTQVWHFLVDGKLYFCTDSVPIINFIPPFVHPDYGDYYIAPEPVVYSVWLLLVLITLLLPVYLAKKTISESKNSNR